MADLEKLALKRDRGYLVRLLVLLGIGTLFGLFLFQSLTGARVGGCVADAYLGRNPKPAPAPTPAP